nr:MAG TPA: hypothetical protein [Caudoviricetes sp.]
MSIVEYQNKVAQKLHSGLINQTQKSSNIKPLPLYEYRGVSKQSCTKVAQRFNKPDPKV